MKVSQYLVEKLIEYKVTDVFGIPGGVILDFIYELNEHKDIQVHLNYHEQAAAYAACGYAQNSGKLGVAYATKGPGVTNMITAIAEAYYDSLPVLFITAHSQSSLNKSLRIEEEQEMDHVELVKAITKYAQRIENADEAIEAINAGCKAALTGRKGPVLLDFSAKLLKSEVNAAKKNMDVSKAEDNSVLEECIEELKKSLKSAKRPVLLIGDGVRFSEVEKKIIQISKQLQLPIISSRFSQDIFSTYEYYFGYIGSHGLRYSNFILSKTDCIISLGNRMAFRTESKSFKPIIECAKIIRIDIDRTELNRNIPNSSTYCIDLKRLVSRLIAEDLSHCSDEWINTCITLRNELLNSDVNQGISILSNIMNAMDADDTIVCDIGNNELLVSRAYAIAGNGRKLLHSKAFKTVGSAIGKAIGAYYANRRKVLCIVGDQGIQFNIQELQYIKNNELPIIIVICNNHASEMLKDSENKQGYGYLLHTTLESGYSHPNFEEIAKAYGIKYEVIHNLESAQFFFYNKEPQIIELMLGEACQIQQILPKGYPCQKFMPELDTNVYNFLNNL